MIIYCTMLIFCSRLSFLTTIITSFVPVEWEKMGNFKPPSKSTFERYGITVPVNTWVENFLKDRKQRVACEGMYSDWAPVISGVPQGSVIAPILFLIYINDLPNNLKSTVRHFADDTIIYMTISNGTDATALQQDLDKLAKWEETWQMEFHPQKCSVLHITRSRNPHIQTIHSSWPHTRKGGQREISWCGHK